MEHTAEPRAARSIFTLTVLGAVLAGVALLPGAKAESNAHAPDAGVWLIVTHKVENYDLWKPVYDRMSTIRRKFGWKRSAVYAVGGDRNNVMVMELFGDLAQAKAFESSPELRDSMAASGVSSQPEVRFVTTLIADARP